MVNKRPPLLGYNHNVRHAGRLFHVQTEDSGLSRLYLTTHAFFGGTILATLRSTYGADEPDPVVQKKMQDQHKLMLKRVRDGEFDSSPELSDDKAAAAAVATDAKSVVVEAPAAARPAASLSGEAPARPAAAKDKPSAIDDAAAKAGRPRDSTELAARLGVTPSSKPGIVPPPPIAAISGSAPAVSQPAPVVDAASDEDQEPVLEFEADLPDDEESAPSVTIETDAPAPPAAAAPSLLSQETPLPVARPLASLRDSYQDSDGLASVRLTPAIKVYSGPPRPLVSVLRSRPSAEGVSVQPTLPGMAQRLKEPIRMTSVRINPTAPSPASVAAATAGYVPDPDRLLDEAVLTYLGRERRA